MFLELKDLTCRKTGNNEVNEVLTNARKALAENDYGSGSDYISDVIHEVADSYTPIYNKDVLSAAYELNYYFKDAALEGFISLEGLKEDFSLFRVLQSTYYYMIEQDLYENLDSIMWNYCAELANGVLSARVENGNLNPDKIAELVEDIMPELEEIARDCTNDTFDDVDEKIKALFDEIFEAENEE